MWHYNAIISFSDFKESTVLPRVKPGDVFKEFGLNGVGVNFFICKNLANGKLEN